MKKKNKAESDDLKKINAILDENRGLNFVDRIRYPESYPTLDFGEGNWGTHKMSYSTDNEGSAMVYPQIIYDKEKNTLIDLGKDAMKHAQETGEYIPFTNAEEADWFGKNYKKVWNNGQAIGDRIWETQ